MSKFLPAIIAASIMIPLLLNLLVLVLVTYRVRGEVDSRLSRCSVVLGNKIAFAGLGLMGDVVRVGVVAIIFAFPKPFLKRGLIIWEDVVRFPRRLKFLISIPWVVNLILVIAMCVFRIYGYVYDIHPSGSL